jgi:segregation and condensation protein B
MKKEDYIAIIESILFVSAKPVTIGKIREVLKLPADTILELITEIQAHYADRGINLELTKKGYMLLPNEKYKPYYKKFVKIKKVTFTRQALETIAILLKSDSTKARIDKLRGVNSTRILNELMKQGFVKKILKNGTVYYSVTDKLMGYLPKEVKEKLEKKNLF